MLMKSRSPPMREACLIFIFNFMFTSRSDTIENPSKFTEDKFAKDFQIDILETLVRAVYVSNWISVPIFIYNALKYDLHPFQNKLF